jgi:hypothetical protein
MRLTITACLALSLMNSMLAQDNPSLAYIQRSMKRAAESTPEQPECIRVMFYGQSITCQAWTTQVADMLVQRFPHAQFQFINPSMGSFESSWLIHTAEHDLYYYNPDLLIFHTYGPTTLYEEIIRRVKQRCSSEVVLWTSHFSFQGDKVADMSQRVADIKRCAENCQTALVDVRAKWARHCESNGFSGKELLRDFIHLNADGEKLMAQCIGEELLRLPALGDNPSAAGTVQTIGLDDPAVSIAAEDQSIRIRFTGNYLTCKTLVDAAPLPVKLFLDGQPVEQIPELWHLTRPRGFITERPAIMNVQKRGLLQAEEWRMDFLPDSSPDGKRIHFALSGSFSGPQGEGWSDQDFSSDNGALFMPAKLWIGDFMFRYFAKQLEPIYPEKCSISFTSFPLFPATIPMPDQLRMTLARVRSTAGCQLPIVLLQGIANGPHELRIVPENGQRLPILSFKAHQPAAAWQTKAE